MRRVLRVLVLVVVLTGCPPPGKPAPPKVILCHFPPGNPANAHTIEVSEKAAQRHLEQHPRDHLGPCAPDETTSTQIELTTTTSATSTSTTTISTTTTVPSTGPPGGTTTVPSAVSPTTVGAPATTPSTRPVTTGPGLPPVL